MTYQAKWKSCGLIRWRSLTWAEHKRFEQQLSYRSSVEISNDIYRACVLYGPSLDDGEVTVGVVATIVNSVFSNSAFTGKFESLETKLNQARYNLANDFLLSARAVVAGLFHYTFEEIDEWDEDTFLLRLAQAEFVAGKPLMLVSADQKQAVEQQEKTKGNPHRKKVPLTPAQQEVLKRVNGG